MKIDLAEEHDIAQVSGPKPDGPWYPTIYVSDVEGDGLKIGDEVKMTGKIKSIEIRKTDEGVKQNICIEALEADITGAKSSAKDKNISRLSSMADDESEIDKGIKETLAKKDKKKDEENATSDE